MFLSFILVLFLWSLPTVLAQTDTATCTKTAHVTFFSFSFLNKGEISCKVACEELMFFSLRTLNTVARENTK